MVCGIKLTLSWFQMDTIPCSAFASKTRGLVVALLESVFSLCFRCSSGTDPNRFPQITTFEHSINSQPD